MKEFVARPLSAARLAWLLGAMLTACASPGVDDVALPEADVIALDDREQAEFDILEMLRELELGTTNDDVEAVSVLYAEDSMWTMQDGSVTRGRKAILKTYEDLFRSYDVTMELHTASLEVDGSTARVLGNMAVQLRALGADGVESTRDRFIMVLRRAETGSWVIWRLAWASTRSP